MKTRYKYIHFEKLSDNPEVWYCGTLKHQALGTVEYYQQWGKYIFEPDPGTIYSADCCRDIAKFLEQLNEEKK